MKMGWQNGEKYCRSGEVLAKGRKPKLEPELRKRYSFRATLEEMQALRENAKNKGVTASKYIRDRCCVLEK